MTKHKNCPDFKGHRFPPEIIEYAVRLYFRFSQSLRDVEDLLGERGIIFSHETVRFWVVKFGRQYAESIRRDRPTVGDKWHLGQVVIATKMFMVGGVGAGNFAERTRAGARGFGIGTGLFKPGKTTSKVAATDCMRTPVECCTT